MLYNRFMMRTSAYQMPRKAAGFLQGVCHPRRLALATLVGLVLSAIATPASAWTAAEDASARDGEIVIHELPASEGATMRAHFFAATTLAHARAVLWDHARYPEFIPHAISSKVLAQHGNEALVEQTGGEGPFRVTFVTRRHLEARRITWTTISGDVKRNDGFWEFVTVPGGLMLDYQVHVVPKQPVPQRITAYLQKQALPDQCRAVRKRLEAKLIQQRG